MPNYDPNMIPPRGFAINGPPQGFGQRLASGARGFLGNQDLALALLANSGASPQKRGLGEIFGTSMLQANQMKQGREDDAFKRQYMQAQMEALQGRGQSQPSSVQEYEYAKQNGFKGTFEEWNTKAGQTSRPSSVQEWEFYNALPQEQKQLYLEMKRNPNFTVKDVGGAVTGIGTLPGGGVQTTQLSTPQQEVAFAASKKGAESQAGAIGAGLGGNVADINTKASDAKSMQAAMDMADGLIDKSTGSYGGSIYDALAGGVGVSTEGAKAGASLQVAQASLLSFVPKMSGPQSDADRETYIAAVGRIADTKVPRDTRKAALQTVREMQQKYIDRASGAGATASPSGAPVQINSDAEYEQLPSGAQYVAPDGSVRRKT
jgi:hypothetical protein